jgi:hypothetical protein
MVPIMNPGLGATAREECAGAKSWVGIPPKSRNADSLDVLSDELLSGKEGATPTAKRSAGGRTLRAALSAVKIRL